MSLVSVVFPVPLYRSFSYAVPPGLEPPPPGVRVMAPFGRRRAVGFVVAPHAPPPEGVSPRPLIGVLDEESLLPPDLWRLGEWIAAYYVAPLGMVLKSMLPPGLLATGRRGSRVATPAEASPSQRGVGAAAGPQGLVLPTRTFVEPLVSAVPPELVRRAPARARALEALLAEPGRVEAARFRERSGARPAVLRALAEAGLVRLEARHVTGPRPSGAAPRGEAGHALSADQLEALRAIRETDGEPGSAPPPILLHGVTGSGKTLVYLKLVEEALAAGGNAVVLVPEIGLTPRAAARFQEAFGDRVAVLHSALAEGERSEAWLAMRRGDVRVAVGARSAVFAPFPSLALVVVDEEHEPGYKQEETPRYNARDVAVVRARLGGARAVLGSATPSLESFANAQSDKYLLVTLPRRIGERDLPEVQVIDMRGRPPAERLLSAPLREAVAATLGRGEQVLLLLNRRGFSNFLQCVDCGTTLPCPNCRITLTLHRPRGPRGSADLRCHYCGHREPVPEACTECGGLELGGQGYGTQQVEEAVRELFPQARVARMDHDTTVRKHAHRRLVEAMEQGELDVLVGTQMVAKGHDFPGLTLVGVVSADTSLNVPDFRAAERTFQLVAQVSGRPGRGPAQGRVLVQTYVPDHPAIRAAALHDYRSFYSAEVVTRFEAGYPPALKLASCLVTGEDERRTEEAAREVAAQVEELARTRAIADRLSGVGPSPAPLARLRGRYRWHYLLKSTSPSLLESALARLARRWRPPRGVELTIDRDPYSML